MSSGLFAGIDAGHIDTKAVIMKDSDVLGYASGHTGLDPAAAARAVLDAALAKAGVSGDMLDGTFTTGIFRDVAGSERLHVNAAAPEDTADAAGALFLNPAARTVIDIGGNIHKIVRFDSNGNLIDVVQNDKCADGLGVFYTAAAGVLGMSEGQISEAASGARKNLAVAIQCAVSGESELVDLICRGAGAADAAYAVDGYVVERVASLCAAMTLEREILVAGGLARSSSIVERLGRAIGYDLRVPELPEYVGAIGVAMECRP